MLRFLSRRPKTVKVPIENGQVDIQKVAVKEKSKYDFGYLSPPHALTLQSPGFTRFVFRLALTYCVIETVVWLRSDDFKKRAAEYKRRANETPAEKQKRLQQLRQARG